MTKEEVLAQPAQEPIDEEHLALFWRKSIIGFQISYRSYRDLVKEIEHVHGIGVKHD